MWAEKTLHLINFPSRRGYVVPRFDTLHPKTVYQYCHPISGQSPLYRNQRVARQHHTNSTILCADDTDKGASDTFSSGLGHTSKEYVEPQTKLPVPIKVDSDSEAVTPSAYIAQRFPFRYSKNYNGNQIVFE